MFYREISAPICVQIELTTACSNNCPHCYNYQRQDDDPNTTMTLQELRATIEAIASAHVFAVTLTGGEPLLQPGLVVEGIRLCQTYGISCSINTNLTLMTDELIMKMQEAGTFTVLTSIASSSETVHDAMMGREGALGRTLRGIEILKRHGIAFGANMVVTQQNAGQVYKTGLFVHHLGANMFAATKASPPLGCQDYSNIQPSKEQVKSSLDDLLRVQSETGLPTDILESYPLCFLGDSRKYAKFARRKCTAGVSAATIGSDGKVRPCSHSNMSYGSIFEESLPTIYSRMTAWRTGKLLPTKCLNCEHLRSCSGGCRCEAEYAGNVCGVDPYSLDPGDVVSALVPEAEKIDIILETIVSVDSTVRFRRERFGYILWRNHSMAMVGEEAGKLLLHLQKAEMQFGEAVDISGFESAKVAAVLTGLVPKRMVQLR